MLEARRPRAAWAGRGASPRLLSGVAAELELVKCRQARRQGAVERLTWRLPEAVAGDESAAAESPGEEPFRVLERAIA